MIHHERRGPISLVTIDRPERRNALDHAALEGLLAAFAASADSRGVVLTGTAGHFCAGADLSSVEDDEFVGLLNEVLAWLRDAPLLTVAAVEGAALGAGTQLAIACDVRIAAPDATFGVPAAKLGLMVEQWTIRRLAGMVGQGEARALMLTAETVTGERAHQVGLVQRLGSLDDALALAERVARLAPFTIAGHKVGLNEAEWLTAAAPGQSPAYAEAFDRAWGSEDLQEGLAAFGERRPPVFHGR